MSSTLESRVMVVSDMNPVSKLQDFRSSLNSGTPSPDATLTDLLLRRMMVGGHPSDYLPAPPPPPEPGFTVSHQKVHLDLDFKSRKIKGRTDITINPLSSDLKAVKINIRQAQLTRLSISGKAVTSMIYDDPYKYASLGWDANVHQYHMLQERIEGQVKSPPEAELTINIPRSVKIYELDTTAVIERIFRHAGEPLGTQNQKAVTENARYTPIIVHLEFVIVDPRDGLHFAGWDKNELQYPHAYTKKTSAGSTCSLFPCVDSIDARCTWEISIRTPRTIGDAIQMPLQDSGSANDQNDVGVYNDGAFDATNFSEEDCALDLVVICSGDVTDEIVDQADPAKKTTSFFCASAVSAQHIGFAVGPFEYFNLAAFRESDDDEKLGKNAIPIHGFCLPGRMNELQNTCLPMAKAMDFIVTTYGSYPFSSYKICFVDGMLPDRIDTATLSICSNRLLFPENIIDTMDGVTRELIYGLACQWVGINITPKEPTDLWTVVGMAFYITDMFLRKLCGNNEYRFSQTKAAERLCATDVSRPSMHDSGRHVPMDGSHMDLIAAKAPLVLYILDRRLTKTSGSTGLSRIISRVLLNANIGEITNGAISTAYFMRLCERLGHTKLDVFFNQWVLGAGCPRFRVTQRFNKKRLVVEMQITQVQSEPTGEVDLESSTFMRDVKEDYHSVWAGHLQPVFTGPMTIRIHEADGTPYEHIVEIKEAITRFEIPYNTKYKRLKRSRRHREKVATGLSNDPSGDVTDDALLYCLGDVLQTPDEEAEWKLSNWTKEDEERMSGESYEWIRMDADFEWICRMTINMPGYMFVSQLQQDRDVSAQYETIQYLASQKPLPLVSTILVRTLMDKRYFHGIRTAAALALAKHAKDEIGFIGLEHLKRAYQTLFCFSDSNVAKANDFSDRASYYVQSAILRAIAQIRDTAGRSPFGARDFLYRKLRENDNSNNDFSDCYYVALLMRSLAGTQASAPLLDTENFLEMTEGDDYSFHLRCLEEIDRHRRIDEWIPSYHNVLSIAALDCSRIFSRAGGLPKDPTTFLQQTQEGGYEDLRISGFSNLLAIGLLGESYILRWFMFVLGYDSSPYIRSQMLILFGQYLGMSAIGEENSQAKAAVVQQAGDLIIEQESSTNDRQATLARKQTIGGALAALKVDLGSNETLKGPLWNAICSPILTIQELGELLRICDLLYDAETSMTIVLKYPRYYRATNLGHIPPGGGLRAKHLVRFTPTSRIRTQPMPPPLQVPSKVSHNSPAQRRESNSKPSGSHRPQLVLKLPKKPGLAFQGNMAPPKLTVNPDGAGMSPETPGGEGRPKLKLKLKLQNPG